MGRKWFDLPCFETSAQGTDQYTWIGLKGGLIRKVFIKWRGAEILNNFRPHPILWEPLKFFSASLLIDCNLEHNWDVGQEG